MKIFLRRITVISLLSLHVFLIQHARAQNPVVSLFGGSARIPSSGAFTVLAIVSGGSSPYTYRWSYVAGSDTVRNPDTTHSSWTINQSQLPIFAAGSTVTVNLRVTSSSGAYTERSLSSVVNTRPSGGLLMVSPSGGNVDTIFTLAPTGWSDVDGGALKYSYGYFNGSGNKIPLTAKISTPYTGLLPGGNPLVVYVDVSDDLNEYSEATQQIRVDPVYSLGEVSISSSSPMKIQSTEAISVVGTAALNVRGTYDRPPMTYHWSYVMDADTVRNSDTTNAIWMINASHSPIFVGGQTVKVNLRITTDSGRVSSAGSCEFVVNAPPGNGLFAVTPSSGSTDTFFTLETSGWTDDGMVAYYKFGYYTLAGTKVYLSGSRYSTSYTCTLPSGVLSLHQLDVFVEAYDNQNACTLVTQRVTVEPGGVPIDPVVTLSSASAFRLKSTDRINALASATGCVSPYTFQWHGVMGDAPLDLSGLVVTNPTLTINGANSPFFVPGSRVKLYARVVDAMGRSGEGSLEFVVNAPPGGGALSVSPANGTAFSTTFTLQATGWTDDIGAALTYQFGYLNNAGAKINLGSRISGTTLSASFPAGGLSGNQLDAFVAVYDDVGEFSMATQRITVNPPGDLPVELTDFTVSLQKNAVMLAWHTATEINNYGFDIERQQKAVGSWNKIGFVAGLGSTNVPQSYTFADAPKSGAYRYRLKQIDRNGNFTYSHSVEAEVVGLPPSYALAQNYPNPFNPTTTISFSLPEKALVTLKIFNALGQELSTLVSEELPAGSYARQWNAVGVPSGIYFYRMHSGAVTETKRLVLLR